MDMQQKRNIRRQKKEKPNTGSHKSNINWFPGHMTKAKREMSEKLKMVDMVIELRDARIPNASKNPLLDELIQEKPRLIILSKKDKADEQLTREWVQFLKKENTEVLALDILTQAILKPVGDAVKQLMKPKIDRMIARGMKPRAIRVMVVGIPNVGKSTFINRLAKKKMAQTGDRPGVTRSLQWVKTMQDIDVLDTPGVLWPKFEDEQVGVLLAIMGAIRDEILPIEEICIAAMQFLLKNKPNAIKERYHVEANDDPYQVFEAIAHERKFYLSKQVVDYKRTYETFLRELRNDKLGRITWELPYADSQ